MSEQLHTKEHGHNLELDPKKLEALDQQNRERRLEAAEQAERDRPSTEKLREAVEKAAKSKDEVVTHHKRETAHSEAIPHASGHLRHHAAKQRIKHVQRQLPIHQRQFSKFVHQKGVDAVSNAAEGTVARPSGLLYGGLFSVLSSLVVLYICKHYGFEYNFTIGLICFIGGFFLGLIIEGGLRLMRRPA